MFTGSAAFMNCEPLFAVIDKQQYESPLGLVEQAPRDLPDPTRPVVKFVGRRVLRHDSQRPCGALTLLARTRQLFSRVVCRHDESDFVSIGPGRKRQQ